MMCRNDKSTFEGVNMEDDQRTVITCHFTGFSLWYLSSDFKNQIKARLAVEYCILVVKCEQPRGSVAPEQGSTMRNVVPTIA